MQAAEAGWVEEEVVEDGAQSVGTCLGASLKESKSFRPEAVVCLFTGRKVRVEDAIQNDRIRLPSGI